MGVLRPEGSLPPRVYWVRRAVVLLVVVAVVVLAVVGVRALLARGDDPDADPAPATSPSQGETTAAADTPVCDPAAIALTLTADAASYPAEALPTFTVRVVNDGDVTCLLDAGDAQRQIVVTSGTDRIWASTDCATGDELKLLLEPEQADERQVQWDRIRSVEGCANGQAAALPGTYQAVLTLSGVSTEPVVFGLE